jgi:endoglucanase
MVRLSIALAVMLVLPLQGGCRAEDPWPLWSQYAQHFVDGQGRVVDRSHEDRTTSEGQAYAMFFALVANDRTRFASLLSWTEANLAGGDLTLRLPAWSWGKRPDGTWGILDPNPASDADVWMAYALLEAGRLWHDDRYAKLGSLLADRIAHEEVALVPGLGNTLLPGPQGFHPDNTTWILNPSYIPVPVLAYFAKAMPQTAWSEVLHSYGEVLRRGTGGGFAMDWVVASADASSKPGIHTVALHPSPKPETISTGGTSIGSYDAIRIYLWLGIADPATPGLKDFIANVPAMADYLKANSVPPLVVDSTGKVIDAQGTIGFSAAVTPYLSALHLKSQATKQMDRLTATKDASSGLYGREAAYYDQNLALFATGWAEQYYRLDRDGRLKLKWKSK